MKHRSVLLSAALVFFTGIGFVAAEDSADESDYIETTYIESGRTDAPVGNSLGLFSDLEKGWISLGGAEISESETAALFASLAGDRHSVYDPAVSFADIDLDGFGFFGFDDTVNPLDAPEADAESSANSLVSVNGPYTFLIFKNLAFTNSDNRPQFISDSPYSSNLNGDDNSGRSPYSFPVTILFITIMCCVLLVLFTSTGFKLKD